MIDLILGGVWALAGLAKILSDISGDTEEREKAAEIWHRLHRELYGTDGDLSDDKTIDDLKNDITMFAARIEKKPLVEEWKRLHREVYGCEGYSGGKTVDELKRGIDEFSAKKPLVEEWKRLVRELYGQEYLPSMRATCEDLKTQIDDLSARKPLIEELDRLHEEMHGAKGEWSVNMTSGELRQLLENWKSETELEKQWKANKDLTVSGTIAGSEQRTNDLGLDCRGFRVNLDNGGIGFLPLGALDRAVQNNVRREFQRMTGRSIRYFSEAYPLYAGKRICAKIAKTSQLRGDGHALEFELADGVVEGYERKKVPRVPPKASVSEGSERADGGDDGNEAGASFAFHVGDVIVGHVQNTAKYGVFVDLEGGVTGLLHVKDMGLGYVRALAAVFGKGDAVKVEVTGISEKDGRRRVGFRLLEFPDKAPLAAGAGKERPTLLLDGPGLWRSFGDWKGKGLAMLLDACRKARRRAVLVTDAGLERDMEQTGDADGLALMRDLRENHPSSLFVCPEGADSVASAMRRRACIQQCRIVSNDAALASAVGVEACSVASDAGGLSVPELGLQCESTTADGKASRRTTSKILVDGVNCTRAQLGGKGLATILGALKEAGRVPFTFFDASMQGKPDKDLQALILRLTANGEACVVPSGSDMDDYLLPMADSCGLDIVTNKRFHGKEGKYPWLTKRTEEGKRLHPFSVVDGMLLIPSLDICTPLEHGTVTKEVTEANT